MTYRYIVVDDEILIRKGLISKIEEFSSLSAECAGEAANGLEGLRLIEEVDPDIIITDMKMKKMDGVEFLERVGEQYADKPIIVISGYKAFDYISKAIEKRAVGYVLKPFSTEEIGKQMLKAAEQIEKQKKLILLEEKAEYLEQKKSHEVLINVISEPWIDGMEEELLAKGYDPEEYCLLVSIYTQYKQFEQKAKEICGKYLNDIKYEIIPKNSGYALSFLLLHCKNERLVEKMEMKAVHIAGVLKKDIPPKIFICIDKPIRGYGGLHGSFLNNEKLVRSIRLADKSVLIRESKEKNEDIWDSEQIQDIFLKMKCNHGQARLHMENYFNKMDIEEHTFEQIGAACEYMLQKVNRYALQLGVDIDDIMGVFYKRYLFCEDLEKMKNEISGYVALIFNSIRMKTPDEELLFLSIRDYIKSNYHKKLTLSSIASNFYVSNVYCSNLLKEKLNKSFNEYVSELRIEKAKQLLRDTKISAEGISEEIGYLNPKYFYKVFKKTTGKTPIEFREKEK